MVTLWNMMNLSAALRSAYPRVRNRLELYKATCRSVGRLNSSRASCLKHCCALMSQPPSQQCVLPFQHNMSCSGLEVNMFSSLDGPPDRDQ